MSSESGREEIPLKIFERMAGGRIYNKEIKRDEYGLKLERIITH